MMHGQDPSSNEVHGIMTSSATKFCPLFTACHTRTASSVTQFDDAFACLDIPLTATPLLTVLIGKRLKSEILRHFLRKSDDGFLADRHGQVYLWKDPKTQHLAAPTVFVDYELQSYHDSQWCGFVGPGECSVRSVDWIAGQPGVLARRSLGTLLSGRVFGPLCDTLCYFASDLGGLRSVASYLAEQAGLPPVSDLPTQALPSVVVVVETAAKTYDCHLGTSNLLESISHIMVRQHGLSMEDAAKHIAQHFKRIQVFGIRKGTGVQERANTVHRRLTDIRQEAMKSRELLGIAFSTNHTRAFLGKLLASFCLDIRKTFSFALNSRPDGACHDHLMEHVKEVFAILPSEAYLFHLLCPLLASALVLASFPPGAHRFQVDWLFDRLYRSKVKRAVYESTVQADTRDAFLKRLEADLACSYRQLDTHADVTDTHLAALYRLRGLIVLGIFLMRWTVTHCLTKFQTLAEQTFRPWHKGNSAFARLQELALSYLRDWQYSSYAIEEAFRSAFGSDIRMFNPIREDTKVAVTTITAKQPQACVFTNYNGGFRSLDIGYNLIRASTAADDVSISNAAACTSAAPWYFKAVNLRNLGVFQDGGLHHNNPLSMALWEVRHLWPRRALPDLALSIGTGVNESVFSVGPHSPVRKRSLFRIFDSFMESMDGEKSWKEFYNGLDEKDQSRFHRLNLPMPRGQPPLDDVAAMTSLESQATAHIQDTDRTQHVIDSLLASSFYLEFDELPLWEQTGYRCSGHIGCRLPMTAQGRKALSTRLVATSSFFVINGQPIACIERVTRAQPSFKRKVEFTVQSLETPVGITLRGITSKPTTISGMPTTAAALISAQSLNAIFGRADCAREEKPLPVIPGKRKRTTVTETPARGRQTKRCRMDHQ
ncbi:hypothetical protein CBER1_11369 [Cercospora berteroae]|uniref:PNPLA domain-containing protein n=1 Tax=Cercospora berteroae TaxID=357750 RepID=A0A2S6CLZ8_9PEZI|nr:hypothetical protein CBER1_11369 [Cercospora berteroae]